MNSSVPKTKDLLNPTLEAIRGLGGSGSNEEIRKKVIELLAVPDEALDVLHGSGNTSEFDYRLAWAKTYLKKVGLINNSRRGVWSLTPDGMGTDRVDPENVYKRGRGAQQIKLRRTEDAIDEADHIPPYEYEDDAVWREELSTILAGMAPDAFERLCQRLLRESGISEVKVTGSSGDGGIDGHGIIRLEGWVSFPVMFQCKRYKSAVGPGVVRDFRGAMAGRSDRGFILTTSTFTQEARREAARVSPPIDLIDGELLIDRIKEINFGVETGTKEYVTVNKEFFRSI